MQMTRLFAVGAALAVTATLPASAQNTNGEPHFGTLNLETGFNNDPRIVNVRAGGSIEARGISGSCSGYISERPDVRLNYTGGSLPLIISVSSSSDTTLVINGPDGRWYCDDDGGANGLNPSVRFSSPRSGRYEIWIGTYASGAMQSARLHVSELHSQ